MRRRQNTRRRHRWSPHESCFIESLETRALLAAVVPAIQLNGQAPTALPEVGDTQLLYTHVGDSTQLYSTDGTQTGSVHIGNIPGMFTETDIVGTMGDLMFFRVSSRGTFWVTNGTQAGTSKIADLEFTAELTDSQDFNGELYFSASNGNGFELWKTDGTATGTVLVRDINTGQQGPVGHTFFWDPVPGAVSYEVKVEHDRYAVFAGNPELHRTIAVFEETVTGTTHSMDVLPASYRLITRANFSDGSQGDQITEPVTVYSTIDTSSSHPSNFAVFGNELYFAAETPDAGREIWRTDGTTAGTTLAVDVLPGPSSTFPVRLMEYDGHLFFGSVGTDDLFRTDGTAAGTHMVAEGTGDSHGSAGGIIAAPNPYRARDVAGSYPIAVLNGQLIAQQMGNGASAPERRLISFDSATDTSPTDLGVTGSVGLNLPADVSTVTFFDAFTPVNGRLVFRQASHLSPTVTEPTSSIGHLWATDGVTSERLIERQQFNGTVNIADSVGTVIDDRLYFSVNVVSPIFSIFWYSATYRTDGTVAGSEVVSEDVPAVTAFTGNQYVNVDETVYYLRPQQLMQFNTLWDLYRVNPSGDDARLVTDLQKARLFELTDQLFLEFESGDTSRWFRLSEDTLHDQVPIIGGIGTQTTGTPEIQWDDAGNDVARYDLYINAVGDRTTPVYRRDSLTVTSHTLEAALADGNYEVWLRAIFNDGSRSRWGAFGEALTVSTQQTNPLTPPTITSPAAVTSSLRPEFTWTAVDGAVRYELWISSAEDVTPIIHETQLTGTSFTPAADLAAGKLRVWVRAHYATGRSRWTPTYRTEILHNTVTITGGVGSQQTTTPTITWNDPGNTARFDLYINETGVSTPAYRRSTLTGTSHTLETPLESGKTYDVWIRAHFNDGSRTRWGSSVELIVNGAPVAFRDIVPSLTVEDNQAAWPAIDNAVQYEIWVNSVDSSGQLIQARVFHDTSVSGTSLNLNLSAGAYRGWLRAIDAGGVKTRWSVQLNFTVEESTSQIAQTDIPLTILQSALTAGETASVSEIKIRKTDQDSLASHQPQKSVNADVRDIKKQCEIPERVLMANPDIASDALTQAGQMQRHSHRLLSNIVSSGNTDT